MADHLIELEHLTVAVDFDGTIAEHAFPRIGSPVPGAFEWLAEFQRRGIKLILWTMRSDGQKNGNVLTDAIEFCRQNGIEFVSHNENLTQSEWTSSPKAYAHAYIDDTAIGCPLIHPHNARPYVDWSEIGPRVLALLEAGR